MAFALRRSNLVHRRTGGLEMPIEQQMLLTGVHRRTGGLENFEEVLEMAESVHRRTGGLESKNSVKQPHW